METFEECIKKMIVFLSSQEEIVMYEIIKEKTKKKGVEDGIKSNLIDKIFFIYKNSTGLPVERDGRRRNFHYIYTNHRNGAVKTENIGYTIPDLYSDEFLNDFLKLENLGNYEGFWADDQDSVARFVFENYTIEIDIIQLKKYNPETPIKTIKRNIRKLVLCFHSIPDPSVPLAAPIEASYNGESDYADYYLENGIPVTTVTGLIAVPDENVEQIPDENVEQIPDENVGQNSVSPIRGLRKRASRFTGMSHFFGPRGGTRKRKMTKRKNIKTKRKKR